MHQVQFVNQKCQITPYNFLPTHKIRRLEIRTGVAQTINFEMIYNHLELEIL